MGSRTPHLLLLTLPGLFRVLMLAGGPVACRFRDWLDSEVLPALYKTGTYTLPGRPRPALMVNPSALPEALRAGPGGALLELLQAEALAGAELPELRDILTRLLHQRTQARTINRLEREVAAHEQLALALAVDLREVYQALKDAQEADEYGHDVSDELNRLSGALQRARRRLSDSRRGASKRAVAVLSADQQDGGDL